MFNGISDEVRLNTNEYKSGYLQGVLDSQKKKEEIKEVIEYENNRSEFHQHLIDTYGHFYFLFYKRLNIEKQLLFRFVYLCTYLNYKGYLSDGNRLIKESQLEELLMLSKPECCRTKNNFIDKKLITITEDKLIIVNDKYCKKGEINKTKSIEVIRMFNDAIQDLYKKSLPREHKKLSLLIEILPYINYKYNVICENPTEEFIELIKPIKLSDLCEKLGYDKTNSSKLKRQLLSLKVNSEDVIGIFEKSCGKAIYVNPRIYYKGGENHSEGLKDLQAMFDIG